MDLILTQDVPGLGTQGTLVTAKDGYARNYLLPRGLATPATTANRQLIEQRARRAAAQVAAARQRAQEDADRLSAISCTIPVKVGDQEKLHGSITTADLADALAAQGVTVDKRSIVLEAPITKLGVYQVPVKLHPDVTASVKVWIVKA